MKNFSSCSSLCTLWVIEGLWVQCRNRTQSPLECPNICIVPILILAQEPKKVPANMSEEEKLLNDLKRELFIIIILAARKVEIMQRSRLYYPHQPSISLNRSVSTPSPPEDPPPPLPLLIAKHTKYLARSLTVMPSHARKDARHCTILVCLAKSKPFALYVSNYFFPFYDFDKVFI